MTHTVEIADTAGNTMQLSVSVETLGQGGSWRSLTKGMINHNSGPVAQTADSGFSPDTHVNLMAGGVTGIHLDTFVSWGTANDQGTGWVRQQWVLGLTPGDIEWSIV
jgi:hypothetical protein